LPWNKKSSPAFTPTKCQSSRLRGGVLKNVNRYDRKGKTGVQVVRGIRGEKGLELRQKKIVREGLVILSKTDQQPVKEKSAQTAGESFFVKRALSNKNK